ncbi:MAG: hypothetical protein HQK65_16090 [Desulfamplus sp.]|nr:hypothetical protein [Desulfamplus sp.]
MPVTFEHIRVDELMPILLERLNVKPQQKITVTVQVENSVMADDDFDLDDVGMAIEEAVREVKAIREGKLQAPATL